MLSERDLWVFERKSLLSTYKLERGSLATIENLRKISKILTSLFQNLTSLFRETCTTFKNRLSRSSQKRRYKVFERYKGCLKKVRWFGSKPSVQTVETIAPFKRELLCFLLEVYVFLAYLQFFIKKEPYKGSLKEGLNSSKRYSYRGNDTTTSTVA